MPTKTAQPLTTDQLAEAVAAARAAFRVAVLNGQVATDEYQAWTAAHRDAVNDLSDRSSAAARVGAERMAEFTRLMGDAKILPELERRAGSHVDTSTGSRLYSREEHEQRVACWLADATAFAGKPITRVSQLDLQRPSAPFVTPLRHPAPGTYTTEVDHILNTASQPS